MASVFFLASFSKIQGEICRNSNFVINFIQKVLCSFGHHFLAAFDCSFQGYPTWLSLFSTFWMKFITKFEFRQISPCILLKEAKKNTDAI